VARQHSRSVLSRVNVTEERRTHWLAQLRERGVVRVAISYTAIAWLLLQAADVTFEPLGLPGWAMRALIVAAVLGFPLAVVLAWHFELGDHGLSRDSAPADAPRPCCWCASRTLASRPCRRVRLSPSSRSKT
jgi:hypothetical protein